MKTMLLLTGMLVVCASSAFAANPGVDLSFNACPGNAGSSQAGRNCARSPGR